MESGRVGLQLPEAVRRSGSDVSWTRGRRLRGWYAWSMAVMTAVIAVASSPAAVAGSSYSVGVDVPATVLSGQSFRVHVRGLAQQKALLYVYLDRQQCRATTDKEAARDGAYRAGESYFLQKRAGHLVNETWTYAWVTGSFERSLTAFAGTVDGTEHACAYLDRPNSYGGYRVTVTNASARYTVKT